VHIPIHGSPWRIIAPQRTQQTVRRQVCMAQIHAAAQLALGRVCCTDLLQIRMTLFNHCRLHIVRRCHDALPQSCHFRWQ
jgi:hypothetical protein